MRETSSGLDNSETDLVVLDRATCLQLLATLEVGRLAWAKGERVLVFPLNFTVDGDHIVFRSPSETVHAAVSSHRYLSFQADDFESAMHSGWTVLASGPAEHVVDRSEIERLRHRITSWRKASDLRLIRLHAREITGRRIPEHTGVVETTFIGPGTELVL